MVPALTGETKHRQLQMINIYTESISLFKDKHIQSNGKASKSLSRKASRRMSTVSKEGLLTNQI